MKLAEKILDMLGLERKSFFAPTSSELFGNEKRLPDPASRNYYPYLRAYADSSWVYTCVNRISTAISALPVQVLNDKGQVQDDSSDVMKLLYKPNPFMNGRELFQWLAGSMELTGNAFLLKDAYTGTRPTELFPLMAHLVDILPGDSADKPVRGYKYRAGGKTAIYQPEDVVHIKYFNPFDMFYGLGPLSAARVKVDIMTASENYNRAFFNNSARVSGILTTEQKIDDAARKRIIAAWQSSHQGEEKAHKTALLEAGLKWEQTAVNQTDMEYVEGQKLTREDVLAVFGVPPAVACIHNASGMGTSASAATKEQQQLFYQNTIFPKSELILAALTENLLTHFDKTGKQYFATDRSSLAGLMTDVSEKSAAAEAYQRMGFTRNEVIDGLGLPFKKDKTGDQRYEPQYVIQSLGGFGGLSAPQTGRKAAADGYVRPTRKELRAHQLARHILAQERIEEMAQAVAKTFSEKKVALVKALESGKLPKSYDGIFNETQEAEKLAAVKLPAMRSTLEAGRTHEHEFIEDLIGARRRAIAPMSKATINDWAKRRGEEWAKDSEAFTREEINAILSDVETARQAGASVEDLKHDIISRMDDIEAFRSRRIAQTETIAALNQSALDAYTETPEVELKGWMSTLDEATRESHAEAGRRYGPGGEISKGQDFQVGLGSGPGPGQISDVGESVNCRCTVYPVVKGA